MSPLTVRRIRIEIRQQVWIRSLRSEWRRWAAVGSIYRLGSRANFYLSAEATKTITGRKRNGAPTVEPARVRQCYDTRGACVLDVRLSFFAFVKSDSLLKARCEHVFSLRSVAISPPISPDDRATLVRSPRGRAELPRRVSFAEWSSARSSSVFIVNFIRHLFAILDNKSCKILILYTFNASNFRQLRSWRKCSKIQTVCQPCANSS